MTQVYNTQEDFASSIQKFLLKVSPSIRKTQLKIIPFILLGMILSESVVASDISKQLKGDFSLVNHDSVVKRIRRLFKNKFFEPYYLYDQIITHVINNYKKKHSDKRVHIVFDHMFSRDNYTVFMMSMRIGKQGIPLWFRCFKGKSDNNAFSLNLLKEGVSYVSNLFSKDFDLIFLADRFFDSTPLMKHIDSLGHTYCIRLKLNRWVLIYDKHEDHEMWKRINELDVYQYHSVFYHNIKYTRNEYITNIVISKKKDVSEPWFIITNGEPKRAIKDYGYRFGAIECIFKNQKSNGFYLEKTCNASLKYFESLYSLACIANLFLTILGSDFSKNSKCYKSVKINTRQSSKKNRKRVLSLFNTGLILFNKAFNSSRYIRIPFTFILYDS